MTSVALATKASVTEKSTARAVAETRALPKTCQQESAGSPLAVNPVREWQHPGRKPAQLFPFAASRFEKLKDKGILFPF